MTARWEYTCRYFTSEDRWNNTWKDKSLETFSEEEITTKSRILDVTRFIQWRGKTIVGGSYQPSITGEIDFPVVTRAQIYISIEEKSPSAGDIAHNLSLSARKNPPSRLTELSD